MAAGDLVVANYQAELRTTLMGNTTVYRFDLRQGISGLGNPETKTADSSFAHADGIFAGEDYQGPRVITIGLLFRGTEAEVYTRLGVMRTTWAPSTTDIPLYMQLPGEGKFYVDGRPRGLVDDQRFAKNFGVIRALATFVATDPTINAA